MEKRIINQLPGFNFTLEKGYNITNNFYPVGSAIAIVDPITQSQMTVMPDRS